MTQGLPQKCNVVIAIVAFKFEECFTHIVDAWHVVNNMENIFVGDVVVFVGKVHMALGF